MKENDWKPDRIPEQLQELRQRLLISKKHTSSEHEELINW